MGDELATTQAIGGVAVAVSAKAIGLSMKAAWGRRLSERADAGSDVKK